MTSGVHDAGWVCTWIDQQHWCFSHCHAQACCRATLNGEHKSVINAWYVWFVMSTGCVILWGEQNELWDVGHVLCSIYVPLPSHQLCRYSDEVPHWSLLRDFSTINNPQQLNQPFNWFYWCTDTIIMCMHFVFYICTPMFRVIIIYYGVILCHNCIATMLARLPRSTHCWDMLTQSRNQNKLSFTTREHHCCIKGSPVHYSRSCCRGRCKSWSSAATAGEFPGGFQRGREQCPTWGQQTTEIRWT